MKHLPNDTKPRIPPKHWTVPGAPPKQSTMPGTPLKQSSPWLRSPSCNSHIQPFHIQSELPSKQAYHDYKPSSTSTSSIAICWQYVIYLHSVTIDWNNMQPPIHLLWLWQRVVCSCDIQGVSQNNHMFLSSWWLMPKLYLTAHRGLACFPARKVTNLQLISLAILSVPFDPLFISTNVWGGGTV